MQVNTVNFTGNVTVLNGAKKYSNEKDIESIKQISDYEDVDFYIYSANKNGKGREYCAFTPLGDIAQIRKFNFVDNTLIYSSVNDVKPVFSIQNAVSRQDFPQTLKIECDREHGELIIGEKNSNFCILFSKYDLNFRLGGYLGEKFTGTLFNKNKKDELVEFNFENGKLCAEKTFKNGELIKEAEFAYDTKGSMTASLSGRLEDNHFNVLLPYNQSEAMFSLIANQLMQQD